MFDWLSIRVCGDHVIRSPPFLFAWKADLTVSAGDATFVIDCRIGRELHRMAMARQAIAAAQSRNVILGRSSK